MMLFKMDSQLWGQELFSWLLGVFRCICLQLCTSFAQFGSFSISGEALGSASLQHLYIFICYLGSQKISSRIIHNHEWSSKLNVWHTVYGFCVWIIYCNLRHKNNVINHQKINLLVFVSKIVGVHVFLQTKKWLLCFCACSNFVKHYSSL